MAEPTVRMSGIVLASLMFHHVNSDSDVVRVAFAPLKIILFSVDAAGRSIKCFRFKGDSDKQNSTSCST